VKVLSLFDGMACGMLAMQRAGVSVDRYVAFEIDKYAVQTSAHNFPMIEHRGDVFEADFTEFQGFDFLVGGSPCTYWSIAQKNNRETEASGMGWELFSQYVRALREAKPKWFIYENNKSMSKAIRESITGTFGFEPICINSALVSAQNRQRLYWVGKQNEDGTYSRVSVDQPEDRGILLKDVMDGCCRIPENPSKQKYDYVAESVSSTVLNINPSGKGINGAVGRIDAKSRCLTTNKGEGQKIIVPVAEPVRVGSLPRPNGELSQSQGFRVYSTDGKSVCIKGEACGAGGKTGLYAIPCCSMPIREATKKGYTEIEPMGCVDMTQPNSKTRRGRNMADKSNCLMTSCQYYQYCGVLSYATPCEWDEDGRVTKAISGTDGKVYTVYEVASFTPPHGWNNGILTYEKFPNLTTGSSCRQQNVLIEPLQKDNEHLLDNPQSFCNKKYEIKDNFITINGKQYPIKLVDGYYIIRKLTVSECMRLQTVPEWYEFPVSNSQAYKMLGNGWTVEVIAHLIEATQTNELADEQLNLFKESV
jgi:DNA (cytosine-5)-methyltransferase 3A